MRKITVIDSLGRRDFDTLEAAARELKMPASALRYRLTGDTFDMTKSTVKTYRVESIKSSIPVKVICISEGYSVIFDSKRDTADELGVSVDTVNRRLRDGLLMPGTPLGSVKLKFA